MYVTAQVRITLDVLAAQERCLFLERMIWHHADQTLQQIGIQTQITDLPPIACSYILWIMLIGAAKAVDTNGWPGYVIAHKKTILECAASVDASKSDRKVFL